MQVKPPLGESSKYCRSRKPHCRPPMRIPTSFVPGASEDIRGFAILRRRQCGRKGNGARRLAALLDRDQDIANDAPRFTGVGRRPWSGQGAHLAPGIAAEADQSDMVRHFQSSIEHGRHGAQGELVARGEHAPESQAAIERLPHRLVAGRVAVTIRRVPDECRLESETVAGERRPIADIAFPPQRRVGDAAEKGDGRSGAPRDARRPRRRATRRPP